MKDEPEAARRLDDPARPGEYPVGTHHHAPDAGDRCGIARQMRGPEIPCGPCAEAEQHGAADDMQRFHQQIGVDHFFSPITPYTATSSKIDRKSTRLNSSH